MRAICFAAAAIIFVSVSPGTSASPTVDEQVLEQLGSIDWHTREQAFSHLVNSQSLDEISRNPQYKVEICRLAQTEIKLSNNVPDDGSEDYSDYLASLIQTIVKLRDPMFLDILYNPMFLNSGNMVTKGVASLGDVAVKREIMALGVKSGMSELSATGIATQMLEQKTVNSQANLALLHSSLLDKSRSPNRLVRTVAVKGLGHFSDTEAIQRITEVANADPYQVSVNGVAHYPVREQAANVLAKIGVK